MSAKKSENWLLVEFSGGSREVVYVRAVVNPINKDVKVGDVLTVNRRGQQETATMLARGRERIPLEQMIKREEPGPSAQPEEEPKDFSSSASSWAPSDEEEEEEDDVLSGDSVEMAIKKVKLEPSRRQYANKRASKKIITPSHRANAVIPKMMQPFMTSRKRPLTPHALNLSINKSMPDSTKKNSTQNGPPQKVSIDVRELKSIKRSFDILFKMLEDMKNPGFNETISEAPVINETIVEVTRIDETMNETALSKAEDIYSFEEDKENENCQSDEFNRSDDNVLITNKYNNSITKVQVNGNKDTKDKEWVPIGSGKTLIHKEQFRKVNWRSYTIATRTLLLAVFPRRILATHSLTGKRSPAFQDKPAKMCLDPKIISDVIMEIMDKFNVKENLVRSIITTKCADECKMWKTRASKKKSKNHAEIKKADKNNEPRREQAA